MPENASSCSGARGGAEAITARERHCMEHAVAWSHPRNPGYRNRFCAGTEHDDWPVLTELVRRGLMRVSVAPSELSGGDTVFAVTAAGLLELER